MQEEGSRHGQLQQRGDGRQRFADGKDERADGDVEFENQPRHFTHRRFWSEPDRLGSTGKRILSTVCRLVLVQRFLPRF